MSVCFRLFGAGLLVSLAGCDSPQRTVELQRYLQSTQVHPGNAIEPLPDMGAAHVFNMTRWGCAILFRPYLGAGLAVGRSALSVMSLTVTGYGSFWKASILSNSRWSGRCPMTWKPTYCYGPMGSFTV